MPSVFDRLVSALLTDPDAPGLRADVEQLKTEVRTIMAKQQDFDVRMTAMDEATTEIANDLQALRDQLNAGGTISEENLAVLDAKIARLQVLGADPANPVPAV